MKSIVQTSYGSPELVFQPAQLAQPLPGESSVVVRLRATSVNTPDCLLTTGTPYMLRPMMGLFRPLSAVRGSDVAGVVEAVGPGVTDFAPGDQVFGSVWTGGFARDAQGTFCTHVVVPVGRLLKKPAALSFEQAAGAVMSGVTALQAIRDAAKVRPGTHILINGASGGVGTFAVQIAKALGAEVTAVCSSRNLDLVRGLGADHVIDYTQQDYTKGEARYDAILDNVMNHAPAASARVLARGGLLVPNSIGSGPWVGSLPDMVLSGLFYGKERPTVQYQPVRENLAALADLVDRGKLRVVIDSTWELDEAAKAVARMLSHRAQGQVILRI